ncbi:GNAT family N-acetyltransferase [Paenibacillus alvei]|uniref:GNAT family N-acetyltransferase n=1 Tax=Paenibacillus alvei TaxID=44250 RepID=UPI003D2C09CE
MKVVNAAHEDSEQWLQLAAEVEYLFGPMVEVPDFLDALHKSIEMGRAFCIRENDEGPGAPLLGGVFFSSSSAPLYKIHWLSVSSRAREQGVATAILRHILRLVHPPAEVLVTTFGEDIADGQPARRLYQKFGFVPLDEAVPNGPEGGSRQKFKLSINDSDLQVQ